MDVSRNVSEDCIYWTSVISKLSPDAALGVGVLISVLSVPTLVVNSAVVVSFIASKQAFSSTPCFLMTCLCVNYAFFGSFGAAVVAPVVLHHHLRLGPSLGCTITVALTMLSPSIYYFLISLTVLMAIDRFLHMRTTIAGQSRLNKLFEMPQIYVLVVVCAAFSAALGPIALMFSVKAQAISSVFLAIITTGVLCLLAVLYTSGYRSINRFAKNNPVHSSSDGSYSRPLYLHNLYRSVLLLIITAIVSYIPLVIGQLASSLCTLANACMDGSQVLLSYTTGCFASIFACCLIDPFIIIRSNDTARAWLLQKLPCLSPATSQVESTAAN